MSDDEELTLSASTLAALLEFAHEEKSRQEEFERLEAAAQKKFDDAQLIKEKGMALFAEDWQLSQFWYSDSTADILADELLEGADEDTVICIASAPSVYAAIKKRDLDTLPTQQIWLLEYDKRFAALAGDKFAFYDYHEPLEVPEVIKGKVNRLLIDPPFLEEECQLKSAQSTKILMSADKTSVTKNGALKYRLISCTGERMRDVIKKGYPDTNPTTFIPEHANGLSNEFLCYASYEGKNWRWMKD